MKNDFSEVKALCENCRKCELCETRTNVVFGVGNPDAEILFVGEAPGENAFLGYLFGAKTPALASGFYPPFLQTVALTEGAAVLPDFALFECRSLRRVVLPASLTAIGACAMRGCVALEELSVPAGCAAVGDEACAGCAALGNVTLPDGIAVGVNAFLGTPYAAKKAE